MISLSIPGSTVTRSPRCRRGLPGIASSTCGHARTRYWARSRRDLFALANWTGFARSGARAGGSSQSAK